MELPSHVHTFERGGKLALLNTLSLKVCYIDRDRFDRGGFRPPPDFFEAPPLQAPEPTLQAIQVSVTGLCNLRCSYCILYSNACEYADGGRMAPALAEALVPEINESLPPSGLLYITGGEPLTNWEVARVLLERTRADLVKVLITNGTLVSPGVAAFLAATGTNVLVSLDGPQPLHDRYRRTAGGGPTFEKVRRGYFLLREAGCSVGISLVVGGHNQAGLAGTVAYLLNEFHPDSLGVGLPHYTEFFRTAIDAQSVADEYAEIFALQRRKPVFIDQIARRLKPFVEETFRFRDCSACGSKVVVFPTGARSNCISTGPVADVRHQAEEFDRRMPLRVLECRGCEAIAVCGGGCIYDGMRFFGGVDDRNCLLTKRLLECFVWDLYERTGEEFPTREVKAALYRGLIERRSGMSFSIGHPS